jgi:hypothetical protein
VRRQRLPTRDRRQRLPARHKRLLSRLRQLLHTSNIDAELIEREVITDEMAVEHRFLGSPTVRINGVDIDPNLWDRDEYGLSCRLYQTPDGLAGAPPDEWIVRALQRPKKN